MSQLNCANRKVECIIVGEGPERPALEALAKELKIQPQTRFKGGLDFENVMECYEWADVLVLAADSEGWGKAVTEAMAFGCVCIGSDRGMMPQILGEKRGLLVQPRDVSALQKALQLVANHPEESALIAARAAEWGQKLSLDGMREALRKVMNDHWKNSMDAQLQNPSTHLSTEHEPLFK